MASQVLSGPKNVTYTNNTGQNVRVVINYMESLNEKISRDLGGANTLVDETSNLTITWAGVSVGASERATYTVSFPQGRETRLTAAGGPTTVSKRYIGRTQPQLGGYPTEIMLAPGQTFSATCGIYNIVVIPENG